MTSSFRVYRLPAALKREAAKARLAKEQTVAAWVQSAIEAELPGLLGDLRVVFHQRHSGPKSPARLPISESSLSVLKKASAIGVPASLLLELCLSRAAVKGAAKPRRKRRATAR